jgi:large subunit ribosomal protein L6
MSRIGKLPIEIPPNVKVAVSGDSILVEGPKGKLKETLRSGNGAISFEIKDKVVQVNRASEEQNIVALHGLYRSLVHNMILGVSKGYEKTLEIQGVGYKALLKGKDLEFTLGYSHPIQVKAPVNVTFALEGTSRVKVSGPDKHLVGQMAARIRSFKKPEPYKGKGVRYAGEQVRKKAGKAATATGAGSAA